MRTDVAGCLQHFSTWSTISALQGSRVERGLAENMRPQTAVSPARCVVAAHCAPDRPLRLQAHLEEKGEGANREWAESGRAQRVGITPGGAAAKHSNTAQKSLSATSSEKGVKRVIVSVCNAERSDEPL